MARNVVSVRIKGGLGNQLFCYAAARRLSLINNAELVIDDVTGFVRDHRYGRRYALDHFRISARKATPSERMEPFDRYRRGLAKAIARRQPFCHRRYVEQEGIDFDPRLLDFKCNGTVYLDGYWQSEDYFKDIEQTIRTDLRIIPPEDAANRDMAQRIRGCNAVAVHVRWFDDPQMDAAGHNVGKAYYVKAMREIAARTKEPHFFLFSDDPEAARRMVDLLQDQFTCVSHNRGDENAYADLWLMSQCRHFVIANSTFSWWGAWLAGHRDKIVIAPGMVQTGVSSWGFDGLIPPEWVQM
jgi:hypothetical protein